MNQSDFDAGLWRYHAECPDDDNLYPRRARVYDGDTCRLDWDLGAGVWRRRVEFRLWGINAPELNKEETKLQGLAVRDYLRMLLLNRMDLRLETLKDKTDSLGSRYLVKIYLPQEDGTLLFVNDHLIEKFPGQVVPYMRGNE